MVSRTITIHKGANMPFSPEEKRALKELGISPDRLVPVEPSEALPSEEPDIQFSTQQEETVILPDAPQDPQNERSLSNKILSHAAMLPGFINPAAWFVSQGLSANIRGELDPNAQEAPSRTILEDVGAAIT